MPIRQFILSESELSDIYASINFEVGNHTTNTQMRLAKPESRPVTTDDVFEDCYLLNIPSGTLATFISEISTNNHSRWQSPGIIVNCLERGKRKRI
jgi:hypothetical protein